MPRKPVDISSWGENPPAWVLLLAAEVNATSMTAAGRQIGMSRSAVSLALSNTYPSRSVRGVAMRVIAALGRVECPAQLAQITEPECREFRVRRPPTHNPNALRQWQVCQRCPKNPNSGATVPQETPSDAN